MNEPNFLILGCGYTGSRVAARFRARGARVVAASRDPGRLAAADVEAVHLDQARPEGAVVLHSLPVPYAGSLSGAARVVYLSTTGVYGDARTVDERTQIAPRNPREQARAREESRVAAALANHLILRPAAIYGPGRGVQVSMVEGRHRYWGDGSNHISRIHVDDLAAITEAALLATVTGAFPVADDEPARAIDITRFCADLLGLPVPPPAGAEPLGDDTRRSDRRVDGRAIRRLLGVELRYPSYRTGIPASLYD